MEFATGIASVGSPVATGLLPLIGLIAVSAHSLALLPGRYFAIPGSKHDLELVQLVPFLVGPLTLGDGEQRL